MSSDLEYSLGLNLNPFRDSAQKAVAAAGEVSGQLAKKFELRDVGRTLATALGLNLQDMAEKVARFITGVTQEEEANLKRLAELSDTVATRTIEAARARLTEEQRYQLLLQEQEKLQARIAENTGRTTADQVRLAEDKLRLLDVEKQATESLAKMQADYDRQRLEAQRARENEAKLIDNYKRERDEFDRRQAEERDRANKAALAEVEEAERERLATVRENFELMTLEAKLLSGRILPEEKTRLDVLRLQSKEKANVEQMQELLAKGLSNLNPEEKRRLNTLIEQNRAIEEQITALENVKDSVGAITTEVAKTTSAWKDFQIAINSVGRGDAALSDAELQKKLRNLNNDIATRSAAQLGAGSMFTASTASDPFLDAQRSYLAQTQAELDLRATVRRNASFFGEARAFQMFGGSEQRFNDILRGITEQQQVNRQLAANVTTLTNLFRTGNATVLAIPPRG